jgi:citrate lyase subunit beta / citryl-CoA lyase
VLYMPGSNARALEKARALPADALILDLEDAVAPDAKEAARSQVAEAVKGRGFGKREVIVRINALATQWGEADLGAAAAARPDAILVPKVSSPDDLAQIEKKLGDSEVRLWAMIESPLAILNLAPIAAHRRRLSCFVVGTNDLVKEMHGRHIPDRANLAAALSLSVLAARGAGIAAIDGVFNDIDDSQGFVLTCQQARDFGFDGKTLIHPSQIEPCNRIFAPSEEEVEAARKLIAAFDLPENRARGAIRHEGKMVELLHADIARNTVALADAIAELG